MKRENYRSAFRGVMAKQEVLPHVYGHSDCLLRLAETLDAILDEGDSRRRVRELAERYRGRYATLEEAEALLAADGHTMLTLVGSLFEQLEHPVLAEDGDIGAVDTGCGRYAFGHVDAAYFYPSTERGQGILPRSVIDIAFRVA